MKILNFSAQDASVVGYIHEDHERLEAHKIRPALVVCPGGGYGHLSPREADPPALSFFAMGYQVFILSYSLREQASQLRPLHELGEAVKTIRQNSTLWHIDPEKIAVIGFSAGAHLAGSLGTLWNHPAAGLTEASKPNAMILCYPVVTMGEYAHVGSQNAVTGGDPLLCELLSLEKQITQDCPPVFVWHTVEDATVPLENTILLISALRKQQIPFECHIFPEGRHGLSVCTQETESLTPVCHEWLHLCQTWLNGQFQFVP